MSYLRTCCGSCQGSTTCIRKKIQNPDFTTCMFDLVREPVPVCCLFREKSGVFKVKRLQIKCQIFIMDLPLLWQVEEFPFTAAFFATVVVTRCV